MKHLHLQSNYLKKKGDQDDDSSDWSEASGSDQDDDSDGWD